MLANPLKMAVSRWRVYNSDDGYDWVQLDDGGWVAAHLLGI